ncbi:MAG: hypothetical protein Q8K34_06365, partial [Hydrogenophaga sp.]|nr:hypothetical protein [Hydrogenophaga sp.]
SPASWPTPCRCRADTSMEAIERADRYAVANNSINTSDSGRKYARSAIKNADAVHSAGFPQAWALLAARRSFWRRLLDVFAPFVIGQGSGPQQTYNQRNTWNIVPPMQLPDRWRKPFMYAITAVIVIGVVVAWRWAAPDRLPDGIVGGNGRLEATTLDVAAKSGRRWRRNFAEPSPSSGRRARRGKRRLRWCARGSKRYLPWRP